MTWWLLALPGYLATGIPIARLCHARDRRDVIKEKGLAALAKEERELGYWAALYVLAWPLVVLVLLVEFTGRGAILAATVNPRRSPTEKLHLRELEVARREKVVADMERDLRIEDRT